MGMAISLLDHGLAGCHALLKGCQARRVSRPAQISLVLTSTNVRTSPAPYRLSCPSAWPEKAYLSKLHAMCRVIVQGCKPDQHHKLSSCSTLPCA